MVSAPFLFTNIEDEFANTGHAWLAGVIRWTGTPVGRCSLLWTPTKWQIIWTAVSRALRTSNLANDGAGSTLLPLAPGVRARSPS